MTNNVIAGKADIDLHTFTGAVLEEKTIAATEVSSEGGGGYVHQGSGYVSAPKIVSKTTMHNQIFLRNDEGQEKAFKFQNLGLPIRTGQKVSVILGTKKGEDDGHYLAVYNHTTGETQMFENTMADMIFPKINIGCGGLCLGLFVVAVILIGAAEISSIVFCIAAVMIAIVVMSRLKRHLVPKKHLIPLRMAVIGILEQFKAK